MSSTTTMPIASRLTMIVEEPPRENGPGIAYEVQLQPGTQQFDRRAPLELDTAQALLSWSMTSTISAVTRTIQVV